MTFTPIGLQASDIARSSRPTPPSACEAARPHPARHPRHPCPRHSPTSTPGRPRRPAAVTPAVGVGTEAHAGMARILDGLPDWEAEIPVELPGYGIRGTCDAYHRPSRLVLDWKFVGAAAIGDYKANGPGPQYRTQVHLYGLALAATGRDVDRVGIAFIPALGCPPHPPVG